MTQFMNVNRKSRRGEGSSERKKVDELKRILSEERQTHKKTIGKIQKELTRLRSASPYGALASEERAGLLRELDRERMMRVATERRMQGMQLESDSCRARLAALQDECRKMEEMVANMLQYKAKVDQLKQENASMKSSYEANLQKYCSHISSLERDNMVLRNQVKKMESQIHGKGDERDKSKLLLERLKMVEAENSSLVLENEQQRQQYEKCLDEIANQVVQALLAQKVLREECFKLQTRVHDLELQNKHLNNMFQQRMKGPGDSPAGCVVKGSLGSKGEERGLDNKHYVPQYLHSHYDGVPFHESESPIINGGMGLGGDMNLDYMAIAGSLHSMCSEVMGDDSPGKPQLSSPPPWLRDKLMGLPSAAAAASSLKSGSGGAGSGANASQMPSSSSPDSITSSSQQSRSTVESAEQAARTKIETEFPATNASPKMKHVPVGDRRSQSLERGSSGPFSWMKRMGGKSGRRSRRGSETQERSDYDDDDQTSRQRLKQSTSADALTLFGVGKSKKSKSSPSSTTSSKKKLSQSMDTSDWKDSLTPERLNAKGAKLLLRTTSADLKDAEKNSSAICDVNHQSFEAFNKSFEKLLAKNSSDDKGSLEKKTKVKGKEKAKQSNIVRQEIVSSKTTAAQAAAATITKETSTSTDFATAVSQEAAKMTKNQKSVSNQDTKFHEIVNNTSNHIDQSSSTNATTSRTQTQIQKQQLQKHQFRQQHQQQHQQHQLTRSNKNTKPISAISSSASASSSSSQALRNPFAEPQPSSSSSGGRPSHQSAKSPSPLPGQYYYYDYSDEDSDSRPVSRDFSTASTMSLNEILDSSQEAEVALDDDFFSDWSSVCISPQKRIDKLTGQTISNRAMVSKGKGVSSSSSSSSSSSKLNSSSSPDSPRHLQLYKAFININKQQQQQQQQQQFGAKPDLLQHFKHNFSNTSTRGKPEPIYDEPYIPELDPTAQDELINRVGAETEIEPETEMEPPMSAPIVSKTISQKAITRSLTDPSTLTSPVSTTTTITTTTTNKTTTNSNTAAAAGGDGILPATNFPTTEVKAEIHTENFQRSNSNSNFQPSPSLSPNPSQISQDLGYASKGSGSYYSQSSPSPSPSLSHRGTPPWLQSTKDPHSFSRNELLSLVINRDAMTGSPRFIPNSVSPSSDSPKLISRPGQLILAPQDKNFNFHGGYSSVSSTSSSEDKSPIKMFESKSSINRMESSVIEVKKGESAAGGATASMCLPQNATHDMAGGSEGSVSNSSSNVSLPTSPNSLKSPTSKIPPPVARKPTRAVKPETRSRTTSSSSTSTSTRGDNNNITHTSTPKDDKKQNADRRGVNNNNNNNDNNNFPGAGNTNMTVGFVLQENPNIVLQNPKKSDIHVIDTVVRSIIMSKETLGDDKNIQDSPPRQQPQNRHHHRHSEFGSPSHQNKICPSSDSSFENLRVERSGSKDDGYSTMSSDIHPEMLERFCDTTLNTTLTLKRSETNTEANFITVNTNNKTGSLKISSRSGGGKNYHRALLERRNSDSVLQSNSNGNSSRDRSFDNLISDQDSAMETSAHSTTAEMVTSSCSSQISMSSSDLASPTTLTNKISKMVGADAATNSSPSSSSFSTSIGSQGQGYYCKTSSPKKTAASKSSTDLSSIPVKNNNINSGSSSANKVSKIARLFEKGSHSSNAKSGSDQHQPTAMTPPASNTSTTKSPAPSPTSPRHFFPNSSSNIYHQQPESPRRLTNEFQKSNQHHNPASQSPTGSSSSSGGGSSPSNTNTVIKKKSNSTTSVPSVPPTSPLSPKNIKGAQIPKRSSTTATASAETKNEKLSKLQQQQQQRKSQQGTTAQNIPNSKQQQQQPSSSKKSPSQSKTTDTKITPTKIPNFTNKKTNSKSPTLSASAGKTPKISDKQNNSENKKSFSSPLEKVKNAITSNSIKKSKENNAKEATDKNSSTTNASQKKSITTSQTDTTTTASISITNTVPKSDSSSEFTLVLDPNSQDSSRVGVVLELVKGNSSQPSTANHVCQNGENRTSKINAEFSVMLDDNGKVDRISESSGGRSAPVSSQYTTHNKQNAVLHKDSCLNNTNSSSTIPRCDACRNISNENNASSRNSDCVCKLQTNNISSSLISEPACSKASSPSSSSSSSLLPSSVLPASNHHNKDIEDISSSSSSCQNENRKSLIVLTNQAFQHLSSCSDDSDSDFSNDGKPLSTNLPPQYKPILALMKSKNNNHNRHQEQLQHTPLSPPSSSSSSAPSSSLASSSLLSSVSLCNEHYRNMNFTSQKITNDDSKAISCSSPTIIDDSKDPKAIICQHNHHATSSSSSSSSSSLPHNLSKNTSPVSNNDQHPYPQFPNYNRCQGHDKNNSEDHDVTSCNTCLSVENASKDYFSNLNTSSTNDNSNMTEPYTGWQYYQATNPRTPVYGVNAPVLRRSLSDHSIHIGSTSISKLSTSSTSSCSDDDGDNDDLCHGNTASPAAPLQRSASASQLDLLHKRYWGSSQGSTEENFNSNDITTSLSTSSLPSSLSSNNHHKHQNQQQQQQQQQIVAPNTTHHFQRFHGYHNVYGGHHRQQLQKIHRMENYPFLTQSLRLDLSDVTELDEDGSELASTKDSLDTSTGGVTSDESPRPSTSDKNQFNSQFYSLCQVGSNKSLLSSSFESKEKLSMSTTSNSCQEQISNNAKKHCKNKNKGKARDNGDRNTSEEDEINIQEFDQISKQIASLSKTVDELNHSLSSLNSEEFGPSSSSRRSQNDDIISSSPQAAAAMSSNWGGAISGDGSAKTDADGYHWVDDEFYLAPSSNEKLVIVKSSAKQNDYVDYTTFCHSGSYGNDKKVEIYHHTEFEASECSRNYDANCSSLTDNSDSGSMDEGDRSGNCTSRSRSLRGREDMSMNSSSHFEKVVYRRQWSERSTMESSRLDNIGRSEKKLVRWTSEGNLNTLQRETLRDDSRRMNGGAASSKRLSMPVSSNDLEKAFEGWDVESPDECDKPPYNLLTPGQPMTSSSDEDGDSLASDIGLDHMMCQRLIGPNAVPDRESSPTKIGLKMNQLILCYTRESSREEGDGVDLDRQMWNLSEKVDRLSESSKKIWDAAAVVLGMRQEGGGEEGEEEVEERERVVGSERFVDRYDDDDDEEEEEEDESDEGEYSDDDDDEIDDEAREMIKMIDIVVDGELNKDGVVEDDDVVDDEGEESESNRHHLAVPETRDVGIDAMSRSQNSLTNSVEVVKGGDSKRQSHLQQLQQHHPHHHLLLQQQQDPHDADLSSSSLSRSLSSSSSSSSLSLSITFHRQYPQIIKNNDFENKNNGCNQNHQQEEEQPKCSTPEVIDGVSGEVSLSSECHDVINTVGNDGSLDRSRPQHGALTTSTSEHEEEFDAGSSEPKRLQHQNQLQHQPHHQQQKQQQHLHYQHHYHHQQQHSDGSIILNTSANNYMNIDKITTYSDFVADLEMNAICENNPPYQQLPPLPPQSPHQQQQHHHHQQQQHHQNHQLKQPHRSHTCPSPIRTITNGSLTPTSLERRNSSQTRSPATVAFNNTTQSKLPSPHRITTTANNNNTHCTTPPSSSNQHHHHRNLQLSKSSPPTSSPSPQHNNHPINTQTPFNPNTRPHAPYVNQTIPRLLQSSIPPFHTNNPAHRPQSYPFSIHHHHHHPQAYHQSQPPPPPPPQQQPYSKRLPQTAIDLASLFPPPPQPPPPPAPPATTTTTPNSDYIDSTPPPLPPRLPNSQITRTQDGRPQVMIRPHRIQKQNSSPLPSTHSSSQQRPHSFNHYLLDHQGNNATSNAQSTTPINFETNRKPRCSSAVFGDSTGKNKQDGSNNSNNSQIPNSDDEKLSRSGSKIPRRKLKTRRELVAMRKKKTPSDCVVMTEGGVVAGTGNSSCSASRKVGESGASRSWRDIDVTKGTPLSDSSGGDNTSS